MSTWSVCWRLCRYDVTSAGDDDELKWITRNLSGNLVRLAAEQLLLQGRVSYIKLSRSLTDELRFRYDEVKVLLLDFVDGILQLERAVEVQVHCSEHLAVEVHERLQHVHLYLCRYLDVELMRLAPRDQLALNDGLIVEALRRDEAPSESPSSGHECIEVLEESSTLVLNIRPGYGRAERTEKRYQR